MDVSQSIKEDMLNNQLPRGVPLRQKELSLRYGVSRIPIRDALLSLKGEGWLVPHGKAGVMIPDLNWKEAEDLWLMRAELECLLFSMAFDRIKFDDLTQAKTITQRLDKDALSLIERGELNWQFHHTLYRAAERPTLHQVVARLNIQVVRYMGFQYGPLGYKATSQDEHSQLIDMIEAKEKQAALLFLRRHIEEAGRLLVRYLKQLD